jgi:hypothetical protein
VAELSHQQVGALGYEVDDAVSLLGAGRRALMSESEPVVVITLLGSGAEKLLKLTLGLVALDETGAWPSQQAMRGTWGHNVEAMAVATRDVMRRRRDLGTAPGYLDLLLEQTGRDAVLDAMLRLLSRHGRAGRFYNLDSLAGATDLQPPPRDMWEEMELSLVLPDPDLLSRIADPHGYPAARRELNALLDEAFRRWLELHFRAWQHGVIGPHARAWSAALMNVAR